MEEERVNFFRFLCLLTEVVAEVLRCRLKQSFLPSKVQTLQSFLKNDDVLHTLFHLFFQSQCCSNCVWPHSEKGLYKRQWNVIYDADRKLCCKPNLKDSNKICLCCVTPKDVDTKDLDLSLLSLILINCCKLGPNEVEAVKQLRQMKNDYASHNTNNCLTNTDFNRLWSQAKRYIIILNNTNLYLSMQENILHRPMDEALMQNYFVTCQNIESQVKFRHKSNRYLFNIRYT